MGALTSDTMWSAGYCDLEFDQDTSANAPALQSFHDVHEECPDPTKHLVARLYYPADKPKRGPLGSQQAAPYLPHRNYAYGFAKFLTASAKTWWLLGVRRVIALVIYLTSKLENVPAAPGVDLAQGADALPVVVFSHGIGGNRFIYSHLLSRIAAQGFVVLAIEHTDGLGSGAKMAGDRGWVYYKGWGKEDYLEACTRHRVAEVRTAIALLQAVADKGLGVPHLWAGKGHGKRGRAAVLDQLQGRLDASTLVLAGHSYGGATMATVASEAREASCCILFDPWYPAIPRDAPGRHTWQHACPTLVIGSEAYNKVSKQGNLVCDGSVPGLQDRVLTACAEAADGRGAMLVVPNASQHTMVDDIGAIFTERYGWLMSRLTGRRAPSNAKGQDMADRCADSALAFIVQHAPLTGSLRDRLRAALAARWHTAATPGAFGEAGCYEGREGLGDLHAWQEAIFKQPMHGQTGPGTMIMRAYSDSKVPAQGLGKVTARAG